MESSRHQHQKLKEPRSVDYSGLVPTLDEFLALPLLMEKQLRNVFAHATFYASMKNEKSEVNSK